MLLFGAMAQLTQRKKPLQIAIRLFVYFVRLDIGPYSIL